MASTATSLTPTNNDQLIASSTTTSIMTDAAALGAQENQLSISKSGENGGIAESHDQSGDHEVMECTTVEVYMEMKVCRKITTQQIDIKTGKVIHSSFTTEEDPPVIMDIHQVETTEDLMSKSKWPTNVTAKAKKGVAKDGHETASLAGQGSTRVLTHGTSPASLVQQMEVKVSDTGGSELSHGIKQEQAGLAAQTSSDLDSTLNDAGDDMDNCDDDETPATENNETEKGAMANQETKTKMVKRLTRTTGSKLTSQKGSAVKVKHEAHVKRESIITTRSQAAASTPSTPKSADNGSSEWTPKSAPPALAVKRRGSGRPARTIKRPRKFESDAEEEDIQNTDEEVAEDKRARGNAADQKVEENPMEQLQLEEGREVTEEERVLLETMVTVSGKMCSTCGKRFATVAGCIQHVQRGGCGTPLSCKLCPKVLSSEKMMERHLQGHRDEDHDGTYKCADCKRTYATRGGYMKHKRQGTCFKRDDLNDDGTVGDFRCALCDTRFKTESLLKLHISKSHESPGSKFECKDCGRVFYSKQGFAKHESAKSCTQPLRCLVCGKMYSNKARESFKVHMKHHMAEAEGVQYQCEDCGRTYLTPEALRKHKIKHSDVRPHKCPTCNKSFPMRYMVREHMRTHSGDKPYLCNLCGTSFGNRGHLYRHIRSHELGTLHKRGRPRKNGPILLKIATKGKSGPNGDQELVMADSSVSVMEIKSDPSNSTQDTPTSIISGPTYITVHTADGEVMVDGEVTHSDGQTELTEGQLQHVVMQAEGMTEPMVIQVIRDLTGGATVYQQVEEAHQEAASTTQQHEIVAEQTVVTATPTGVQHHIVVTSPRTQQSTQAGSSSVLYRMA